MPNTQLLETILHSVRSIQMQINVDSFLRETNHKELMATVATVTDLQNSQDAIVALVTETATNLGTMISDVNSAILAMTNQQVPVTQAQLTALAAKNLTILTALQTMKSAISVEDATAVADAPAPPAAEPVAEPTAAPVAVAVPETPVTAEAAPEVAEEPAVAVVEPVAEPVAEAAPAETPVS